MSNSCDPMDCSLPGFSVLGILQARVLEWVAISFSRGSSRPRDQTQVCCIVGRSLPAELQGKGIGWCAHRHQSPLLPSSLSSGGSKFTFCQITLEAGFREKSLIIPGFQVGMTEHCVQVFRKTLFIWGTVNLLAIQLFPPLQGMCGLSCLQFYLLLLEWDSAYIKYSHLFAMKKWQIVLGLAKYFSNPEGHSE